MTLWEIIIAFLVWLSADQKAVDLERPKAAAAVAVARASMTVDVPTPAPPAPTACDCGQTCQRGVWKPDGRIEQRCGCKCPRCVAERTKAAVPCTTGTCAKR